MSLKLKRQFVLPVGEKSPRSDYIYPKELVEQAVMQLQKRMVGTTLYGCLSKENINNMLYYSHVVDGVYIEDGCVWCDITVLNTDHGKAIQKMYNKHPESLMVVPVSVGAADSSNVLRHLKIVTLIVSFNGYDEMTNERVRDILKE